MAHEEIVLSGGIANHSAVIRVGDEVARPATPQDPLVNEFLAYLADKGFAFAPVPKDKDEKGRNRLSFLPGVAASELSGWQNNQQLLIEAALAHRALHEHSAGFEPRLKGQYAITAGDYFPPCAQSLEPVRIAKAASSYQNTPLEQPLLMCHNDMSPANTIITAASNTTAEANATAVSSTTAEAHATAASNTTTEANATAEVKVVGFIDFEYAKPSLRLFDLAVAARHWIPFDCQTNSEQGFTRFSAWAECHELDAEQRRYICQIAIRFLQQAQANVQALAAQGHQGFAGLIKAGYLQSNLQTQAWIEHQLAPLISPS